MKISRFIFFYQAGIFLAIVAALTIRYLKLPDEAFFVYSTAHLILMTIWGFLLPRDVAPIAGSKVQTAGYLYALIGFTCALLLLNESGAELSRITWPLALSLISSVMGWFFGGEISDRGGKGEEHAEFGEGGKLRETLDAMQGTFQSFITSCSSADEAARLVAERHKMLVDQLVTSSETSRTVLARMEEQLVQMQGVVEEHVGDKFGVTLARIAGESTALAGNLARASASVADVTAYLQQSELLVREVSKLLDLISERTQSQDESIRVMGATLRHAVEPLHLQLQALNQHLGRGLTIESVAE